MRPRTLADVVGQQHLLGPGSLLTQAIAGDRVRSMILWGPPGSGKTTLARVIAAATRTHFVPFSAVLGSVAELREIVAEARERLAFQGQRTIVFVDEIHRFNKAQQDAFLPHVEDGTITLVGATTENPSFAVNAALSRAARSSASSRSARRRPRHAPCAARSHDRSDGLGAKNLSADDDALAPIAEAARGRRAPRADDARDRRRLARDRRGRAHVTIEAVPSPRATARCSTTRRARSTTTSSARSSNRCAAPIRTPPSTG